MEKESTIARAAFQAARYNFHVGPVEIARYGKEIITVLGANCQALASDVLGLPPDYRSAEIYLNFLNLFEIVPHLPHLETCQPRDVILLGPGGIQDYRKLHIALVADRDPESGLILVEHMNVVDGCYAISPVDKVLSNKLHSVIYGVRRLKSFDHI